MQSLFGTSELWPEIKPIYSKKQTAYLNVFANSWKSWDDKTFSCCYFISTYVLFYLPWVYSLLINYCLELESSMEKMVSACKIYCSAQNWFLYDDALKGIIHPNWYFTRLLLPLCHWRFGYWSFTEEKFLPVDVVLSRNGWIFILGILISIIYIF